MPDPRFVVQLHAARRLHYDVRLEVDGVLASWAVPKGPSYDPAVRRLAVHVGDHELSHRHFEGPTGDGRGVIVWDEGTFRHVSTEDGVDIGLASAIARGHLTVVLDGVKLHGGWHLVRTGPRAVEREEWLVIKRRDDEAAARDVTAEEPASVRTGRTLDQVSGGD